MLVLQSTELSKMKYLELKLMKILSLYENLPSDSNQLTDSSIRVYYEYLRPAYKSFTFHSGSSADEFFKGLESFLLKAMLYLVQVNGLQRKSLRANSVAAHEGSGLSYNLLVVQFSTFRLTFLRISTFFCIRSLMENAPAKAKFALKQLHKNSVQRWHRYLNK
jgi:hypothetical protein